MAEINSTVHIEYQALQMFLIQMSPPPKDRDQQMAALQLAYNNLATSSIYQPSRAHFHEIATKRYRWSEGEFEEWAGEAIAWAP